MEVVGGSIPLATTNSLTDLPGAGGESCRMLKFLGSTIGIVVLLLKAIF